jgi:hypothetical protein
MANATELKKSHIVIEWSLLSQFDRDAICVEVKQRIDEPRLGSR